MSITDVATPDTDALQPDLVAKFERSGAASRQLATVTADAKNRGLHAIAEALRSNTSRIIAANALDLTRGARTP
ncbi:hypothetical protein GCM10025867_22740 [Frondihabitans sucicola]|uniref:Gamma-glutamyl-phosphate reductase n=1 Tax=Frondihabitans sucicola TaxID=1268041 RepID=A0ABM8GNP3_9MICO|nr:hypothetical protein GCM10025867_22740 [Frondihabitans sucicola]